MVVIDITLDYGVQGAYTRSVGLSGWPEQSNPVQVNWKIHLYAPNMRFTQFRFSWRSDHEWENEFRQIIVEYAYFLFT
jgi:hypothetical protein